MIDRAAATETARAHLKQIGRPDEELALLEDHTLERAFGWVFYYQSRQFLETGDYAHALGGNAPFIVDRRDGSVHLTGTGRPIEYYLQRYERERAPDSG